MSEQERQTPEPPGEIIESAPLLKGARPEGTAEVPADAVAEPPAPRTAQERLDRVKAVMMAEGLDMIAARVRLAPGTIMQGWFEPDVVVMDLRTGQPLQRG